MTYLHLAWITLLAMFGLAACGGSLRGETLSGLQVRHDGGGNVCPGEEVPLIVAAVLEEGEVRHTRGAGGGRLRWDNFEAWGNGATIAGFGVATMESDPRATMGTPSQIFVRSVHQPELVAELSLEFHYDCDYALALPGPHGANGDSGVHGPDGRDGQSQPSSGTGAAPGGRGSDGANGGPGRDGEPGAPGADLEVVAATVPMPGHDHPFLQVAVSSPASGDGYLYLIDPHGGSITLRANGGDGGRGGYGGRGGNGGDGGSGSTPGNGGQGAHGGKGGNGGPGAPGGTITLLADPSVEAYLHVFHFENRGGHGGAAGSGGGGGSGGNGYTPGRDGVPGMDGEPGPDGPPGPPVAVRFQPAGPLW